MSEKEQEQSKAFDPFETWRTMRDMGMEAWSRTMIQAVNSEEYAKATGGMLNTYLTASGPAREAMRSMMVAALEQLQMPTRGDVVGLAERLTNIEVRLDDLDAKLDSILRQRPAAAPAKPHERKEGK